MENNKHKQTIIVFIVVNTHVITQISTHTGIKVPITISMSHPLQ